MEINKIYNIDCLDGMKSMEDNSVDCIITSPPYNRSLRIHYGKYVKDTDVNKYGGNFNDCMTMNEYYLWQKDCISEMLRVTKRNIFYNIQMLTGNKYAIFKLFGDFADKIKEVIVWDKINAEPAAGYGVLNSMFEFIIVFDKLNAISRQFSGYNFDRGCLDNVFRIHKNHLRQDIKHSAVFPVELPETIIDNFTKEGDLILDPYMGSGTTAVACLNKKRNFIGFEINKNYCDAATKRIEDIVSNKQVELF